MKITLIAIGRLKKGPLFELCTDYQNRINPPVTILDYEPKQTDPVKARQEEENFILKSLCNDAVTIALDERGESLRSLEFANKLEKLRDNGTQHLQFVIGGAEGLSGAVRGRANLLLSFGRQTWPHMLARAMLLEQIYRAQTISHNHPYHRE